jgi:hypothetical protein
MPRRQRSSTLDDGNPDDIPRGWALCWLYFAKLTCTNPFSSEVLSISEITLLISNSDDTHARLLCSIQSLNRTQLINSSLAPRARSKQGYKNFPS